MDPACEGPYRTALPNTGLVVYRLAHSAVFLVGNLHGGGVGVGVEELAEGRGAREEATIFKEADVADAELDCARGAD